MDLRKLACALYWLGSLPLRLFICGCVTVVIVPGIFIWLMMDLKSWGCDGRIKSDWQDWYFIDIPKHIYWDFLILGKLDL